MKVFLPVPAAAILFSCGNASKPDHAANVINPAASSCLLEYAGNYDKILTLAEAAILANRPVNEAKVNYNKTAKNTRYHEIVYSWKSDRTVRVHGMDAPDNDLVSVRGICEKNLKDFKRDYKKRTAEEIQQVNRQMSEQLDQAFDKQSDDEKIEASKRRLNDLGTTNESAKKTAKGLGNTLSSSLDAYTEVNGLGVAASWNTKDKSLFVLNNGVEFCVRVNLGEDDVKNKTAAIQAAKNILEKCQ